MRAGLCRTTSRFRLVTMTPLAMQLMMVLRRVFSRLRS